MNWYSFLVVVSLCVTVHTGHGYPADYREDTVLPFSVSPGNVNLETYDWSKHPKYGPVGGQSQQQKQQSPIVPSIHLLNYLNGKQIVVRSRRSAETQHVHGRHGDNENFHNHHPTYVYRQQQYHHRHYPQTNRLMHRQHIHG